VGEGLTPCLGAGLGRLDDEPLVVSRDPAGTWSGPRSWDDPEAKTALVSALVNDARAVIAALEGVELSGGQADAVGLLALVAGQDVEPGDEEGTWPPSESFPIGSSPRWTPRPVTCTRAAASTATATKSTWPWSPRRDSSPAPTSPPPTPPTGLRVWPCSPARLPACRSWPTRLTGQARPERRSEPQGMAKPSTDPAPQGAARRVRLGRFHHRPHGPHGHMPGCHTVMITPAGNATFDARCRGCPLRHRCTASIDGRSLRISEHDHILVEARRAWRMTISPTITAAGDRWWNAPSPGASLTPPSGPLPRRHQEPARAFNADRGPEPPPPGQHRPSPRRRLDTPAVNETRVRVSHRGNHSETGSALTWAAGSHPLHADTSVRACPDSQPNPTTPPVLRRRVCSTGS
jgi:hypothetical protein